MSNEEDLTALQDALAVIWVEDDLTGWPEWDAYGHHVLWGDGDAVAETWDHCMHQSGAADYIAAAQPRVVVGLLADLDGLRAENERLREALRLMSEWCLGADEPAAPGGGDLLAHVGALLAAASLSETGGEGA